MTHTVMFRLKGSEQERRSLAISFAEALNKLPAIIPELISIRTGININPAENWDVALIAEAASLEDIAAYSAHPAHKACVEIIKDHIEQRACVDAIMS